MIIEIHHRPIDPGLACKVHAWDGASTWDLPGAAGAGGVDFVLPDVPDPRALRFLFHSVDPATHQDRWEPDAFIRRVRLAAPGAIWSFEAAARILYEAPNPPGVAFAAGDVLAFHVVTQNRFRGGRLYAWGPFDPAHPSAFFAESSRADPVSTFEVPLAAWMTAGFHFKLVGPGDGGGDWEPDASNRVWRPVDGDDLWVKSGQVSVRREPLALTPLPVEVLFPATLSHPPALDLIDPVEALRVPLSGASGPTPAGAPPFLVARYDAPMYPDAVYQLAVSDGAEGPAPFVRPFPAAPGDPASTSRFILGADGWVDAFPATVPVAAVVRPRPASSFVAGLAVRAGVGTAPAHAAEAAALQPDGTWRATVAGLPGVPNWLRLVPASGDEPKPYEAIDTRRVFTPPAGPVTVYTAEGVYGVTTRGATRFGEPPAARAELMRAAFGAPAVAAGVFGPGEMPHGATIVGSDVYFVLHAPHAAGAALVLVDDRASGGPARADVPMSLTGDALYWWCRVPVASAPPGARYRFALNDDLEVLDPAAREVLDRGDFRTFPGDDPGDPRTSWSLVLDVAAVSAVARAAPWQTMGWEALLLYELHPRRFTDLSPGVLAPLDLLADELAEPSRLGTTGYLRALPVTALGLMPVHEFKSTNSWGYNPAFFFAVDGGYGGAAALARLVNAAHACGRGVLLDLVYNHMNESPLTQVAADVYRNGDAWGDRIFNAHPMVREFFRQATVYLWRTFGLDGFRFDSTSTIVGNDGWGFLGALRSAVRASASAEGRAWPYFVGENDPKFWDITNPAWGVMDGQWDIAEVYDLGHAAYDPWDPADDHAGAVRADMDVPQSWGRPFHEATRFGESHDMVSGQDPGSKRIAARPPFGQGLRMAKAVGAIALLSNGVPMLFMGQEVGETRYFSFDNDGPVTNPQVHDAPPGAATDNTRVLAWFRSLMGLRNDPAKGLRGDANAQGVRAGRRTVAFSCAGGRLFAVVTFGTEDQRQDSSWLGLPGGAEYKEIFNSSWPAFRVEAEEERTNGGYDARLRSGQILNLPAIGAVVLERR